MTVPNQIIAGDSVNFVVSDSCYSAADGWVMTCVLINGENKIELTGTAEGSDHRFAAGSSVTTSWDAGDYSAVLVATKGDERATVSKSPVRVYPDPIASATADGRSQAQITLDALRKAYNDLIASGGAMVQSVVINGRQTAFRSADEIIQQIEFFQRQVNSELAAERLKNGEGLGGRILTRL